MGRYEKQRNREKDWEDMRNRETAKEGKGLGRYEKQRNSERGKRIGKM